MKFRSSRAPIVCAFFLFLPGLAFSKANAPIISRITIRGTDIFDFETKPNLQKFPYTWINLLHFQTKEYVIRHELLFDVGQPVDVFLLRETERNLRALPFIRAARIVTFPQRDGTVVLVVHVNDAWTTEPQLNLSGLNGVNNIEVGFKEKNFLGLGKTISIFRSKKGDVTSNDLGYFDPRLFQSRWQMDLKESESNIGNRHSIRLERPFFSADTRYAAFVDSSYRRERVDIFQNNVKVSEIRQTSETDQIFGGVKIGRSRSTVNHAGLRYKLERLRYSRTAASNTGMSSPDPQDFQTTFLDMDTVSNRFVEMTKLEKMTRVEDVNLGRRFSVSPGISPKILTGKKDAAQFQSNFEKYFLRGNGDVFRTKLSYSTRGFLQQSNNETFDGLFKYYYRKLPRQTLVFNSRVAVGNRLDPDQLFSLGNDTGLRAYKIQAFRGSKLALFNLEDRIYMVDEFADLFAVGGVVFADSGYVWDRDQAVSITRMKSDVGVGLRLGLTRSSNEAILRFDVAYRMQHANDQKAQFVFTFGSDQAF